MKTDTAHRAWNDRWSTQQGRADWLTPEPDVAEFANRLIGTGARKVLDLGCGVGRHALAYARIGLDVTAVDMAESGLSELRRAQRRGRPRHQDRDRRHDRPAIRGGHVRSCPVVQRDLSWRRADRPRSDRGNRPRAEAGGQLSGHHAVEAQREIRQGCRSRTQHLRRCGHRSRRIRTRLTRTSTAALPSWSNCSRNSSF